MTLGTPFQPVRYLLRGFVVGSMISFSNDSISEAEQIVSPMGEVLSIKCFFPVIDFVYAFGSSTVRASSSMLGFTCRKRSMT